jgi:hypothetical protein
LEIPGYVCAEIWRRVIYKLQSTAVSLHPMVRSSSGLAESSTAKFNEFAIDGEALREPFNALRLTCCDIRTRRGLIRTSETHTTSAPFIINRTPHSNSPSIH